MNAYTFLGWDNFFIASAGAAAALAGLLFVAVSINLPRILAIPGLASRAGETFVPLGVVLLVSLLALVPGQGLKAFGVELILFGSLAFAFNGWNEIKAIRAKHYLKRRHLIVRVGLNLPATVAFVLGGVSLLLLRGGGLYWIAPGIVVSFSGVMINAWILLVEILR